jgi:hypothetical protein
MSFRDSNVVIIETSRTSIRAGYGLHELLKLPSVVRDTIYNADAFDARALGIPGARWAS